MNRAKFAMAFHCYQPVFNFDSEFEKAYRNAYLPLLSTLEEFPGVKASFHFSGNILEWFERRHPDYVQKITELVNKRQIEIIGGGCFDPIMALIPERDRKEQLKMNAKIVERIFGVRTEGAWIAERVWEPSLVETLHDAGIKYTIVDDYHILRAGAPEGNIFSPCRTYGGTGSIVVFPALTQLRYLIPFSPPEAALNYMKDVTGKSEGVPCFFFADDGEKFGAWPYTYRHVHKKGWLKNFFTLLDKNSDWLQTATYSGVMDAVPPVEVKEIPKSSYREMMKWSGGDFKNFLTKYPEAGRMHKRMTTLSNMVEDFALENSDAENMSLRGLKKELFKAQSGCAYWHGVFGGLYLPHLRSGVYRHLIKAKKIMDAAEKQTGAQIRVVERDKETVIENKLMDVYVRPSDGGRICELDYKPSEVNLVNAMSRTREKYHMKLRWNYSKRIKFARKAVMRGEAVDVHDILGVDKRGLKKLLFYDGYSRASFLTHIFKDKCSWKNASKGCVGDTGFLKNTYVSSIETGSCFVTQSLSRRDSMVFGDGRVFDLEVQKKITVGEGAVVKFQHSMLKHSTGPLSLRYAVEFNFLIWDKEVIARAQLTKTDRFMLRDMHSGVCLDFSLNRKFAVYKYPVYTINETESGLGKTFQGISVMIGEDCTPCEEACMDDMRLIIAIKNRLRTTNTKQVFNGSLRRVETGNVENSRK